MFKFLKDFLFEEDQVPAVGAQVSAAEELGVNTTKLDSVNESPAGAAPLAVLPEDPGTDVPLTKPKLPVLEGNSAAAEKQPELMLDIVGAKADITEAEPPMGGEDVINLDSLNEPAVVETPPAQESPTPEPKAEEHLEEKSDEKPEEPVMAPLPEKAPDEPTEDKSEEATPTFEQKPEAVAEPINEEEADLKLIETLRLEAIAKEQAEAEALAKFEQEVKEITARMEASRTKLAKLRQVPKDLETAKAELEIILKNKAQVERRIESITDELETGQEKLAA